MKALFPLNLRSEFATFECGSGLLRRPRHANTEWDQARYEVCGHRFCDVSEAAFGVAVLNDCKYGYSVRHETIGLSLLKAGEFPWEMTDKCRHSFTYSLLCHERPLTEPHPHGVFEHAMYLNSPLWAVALQNPVTLPQLVSVSPQNIALTAFKRSEADCNAYIVRLAELIGQQTFMTVSLPFSFKSMHLCDGQENPTSPLSSLSFVIEAFKIVSIIIYI